MARGGASIVAGHATRQTSIFCDIAELVAALSFFAHVLTSCSGLIVH
jgi:hypothetical protein